MKSTINDFASHLSESEIDVVGFVMAAEDGSLTQEMFDAQAQAFVDDGTWRRLQGSWYRTVMSWVDQGLVTLPESRSNNTNLAESEDRLPYTVSCLNPSRDPVLVAAFLDPRDADTYAAEHSKKQQVAKTDASGYKNQYLQYVVNHTPSSRQGASQSVMKEDYDEDGTDTEEEIGPHSIGNPQCPAVHGEFCPIHGMPTEDDEDDADRGDEPQDYIHVEDQDLRQLLTQTTPPDQETLLDAIRKTEVAVIDDMENEDVSDEVATAHHGAVGDAFEEAQSGDLAAAFASLKRAWKV